MKNTADETLQLAIDLINRPSVTPADHGCQDVLIARLEAIGFQVNRLRFGEVDNFWAQRGEGKPLLVFAGHTDVVPPGPEASWHSDPFKAQIRDGYLYGRGAVDMKSSLAAFITGIEDFVARHPNHPGAIGLLITADEEGPSVNGTVKVVQWLEAHNIKIDYCIVGEPSSTNTLGDIIKNGRRGSLNGRLTVKGTQGHVAYPQLAENPIHMALGALSELCNATWDGSRNKYFPKTSLQISNIHAGTGAENVIPGHMDIVFNFRFSTSVTESQLRSRTEEILKKHGLDYEISWTLSGNPFLTPEGALTTAVCAAIRDELGLTPALSTSGGTSDGRFIAPTGAEVVELGPLNATIHKANECIAQEDPARLARVYTRIMENLITDTSQLD